MKTSENINLAVTFVSYFYKPSTLSQKSMNVAENGDCRRKVRLSPNSATGALFCNSGCLSPKSVTIVASVDKL